MTKELMFEVYFNNELIGTGTTEERHGIVRKHMEENDISRSDLADMGHGVIRYHAIGYVEAEK